MQKLEEEMNIIYKIIWSYVKTNPGLEFEDLVSEACIAYLENIEKYDETKGKRSTFIYHIVQNKINSLLRDRQNEQVYLCEMADTIYSDEKGPELSLIQKEQWEELFGDLSQNAQLICNMVLNDIDVYLPIDTPKKCRGIIIEELRKNNHSWKTIWDTLRELKIIFT